MSDTTTIKRYRVTTSVYNASGDWVNLTSVIDARLDLCASEIQIGTYAIEHFKNMLDDELKNLKKGTKYNILKQAIKRVKEYEKLTLAESPLQIHLKLKDEGIIEECSEEELAVRFRTNPFKNEVSCLVEYEIS